MQVAVEYHDRKDCGPVIRRPRVPRTIAPLDDRYPPHQFHFIHLLLEPSLTRIYIAVRRSKSDILKSPLGVTSRLALFWRIEERFYNLKL